jgi:hypothetical protein
MVIPASPRWGAVTSKEYLAADRSLRPDEPLPREHLGLGCPDPCIGRV